MSKKAVPKRHTVIPNGMSEEEKTSESEDELKNVRNKLKNSTSTDESSSSAEQSDSDESSEDRSSKTKKKKKLHWSKRPFVPPSSTFGGTSPPLPGDIGQEKEPIDFFYEMFGKESFDILKDQSNLYSTQTNPNRPVDISDVEIRQFFGILIMSGVYAFPHQRFFWMKTTRVDSVASVMSRDRFMQIKKNLHIVDNTNQPSTNDQDYDRAFKVRPLLNIVKENFRRLPKEEHLTVDEQMIPFKGRSSMKQHMPMKPHRWGYKMFVLAGGQTGICYDFILYTGKSTESRFGFCSDIVLKLAETVPKMINHKIYFDNFFTTISLQVELKKVGIFSTGTVRPNRLPDIAMKESKALSTEGRGSIDHRTVCIDDVVLCATRWYDNNVVNCLSTLHGNESIDTVQRWSAKEKRHVQVKRPNAIKIYSQFKGGVDLLDMLISLYRISIRSKKYYVKIIFHLTDLSIVNSWLLYRRQCSRLRTRKSEIKSLLEFRVNIPESLLKTSAVMQPRQRGRPSLRAESQEENSSTKRRALFIPLPPTIVQQDHANHWPIVTSKGRCRFSGCTGRSTIMCTKCRVRLCLNSRNNCFQAFHQ